MDNFLLIVISIFSLLTVASYASVLAKKIRFPYTVILFVIGISVVILGRYIPAFQLFTHVELSKDLVFFIFLPTLIFESAFNMPYKKILQDIAPITALAVFSLLISTLIIGFSFKLILGLCGFDIPYAVSFIFGAIISATDPVAVLAIFKEFGVPKRIVYLFEAESIFNDGTAVALFFVIMGIVKSGSEIALDNISLGLLSFSSMIIGGVAFGLFMGILFSKLIGGVNDSWAKLTLTLILAHTTFIFSELISAQVEIFKISAIVATTIASLTLGNYGRYKISLEVRKMMDVTWGYFAFISNSLIFLLMGLMIGNIDFHFRVLIIPILIAIAVVIVARIISVIGVLTPLNYLIRLPVSWNWQKLLAWGSLRGAIAITMLLFIPADLTFPAWGLDISAKEFISVIVISCIVFTLLFKAITIKSFIKSMGLANLSREEEFTFHQIKEIIDHSILKRLEGLKSKKYIAAKVRNALIEKYTLDDQKEIGEIRKCKLKKDEFRGLLQRYALGVERQSVLEAFESKQVDEHTLKRILNKIEEQYIRLENGVSQIKDKQEKENFYYRCRKSVEKFFRRRGGFPAVRREYVFYRARALTAEKVLEQLKSFRGDFYAGRGHSDCFKEIIDQYEAWYQNANDKKQAIEKKLQDVIYAEGITLLNSHLLYLEAELIEELYNKHIMNGKVKKLLEKSIWEG